MKRRWNLSVWVGFLVVLAGAFTYVPVFTRLPATRDFPWATLLIFGVGLLLIGTGLRRAYREPRLYRGKIAGPILMTLGLALVALFGYGVFYVARQLPSPESALRTGAEAPDFTLPDQDGNPVTLSKLFDGKTTGVLLIFYRGYW